MTAKRALLLQLPVAGFLWPGRDVNLPLAGGYLASWARLPRQAPGWDVTVLEPGRADVLGDHALLAALLDERPDLVGFSTYLWNSERTLGLAARLTAAGVPVVLGGPELSEGNRWLWEAGGFSAGVVGEGEQAFAAFLRSFDRRRPGSVPEVLRGRAPVDLHRLPSPYASGLLAPAADGSVWLETVRGCPYRCAYCRYGKEHRRVRAFPSGWLGDHLAWAARAGAREVYLMDPSFNVRPDWEETLALLERAAGLGLALHTELVADRLAPGDGLRLAGAGLRTCEVGLQSIHADVLARVGRRWSRPAWVRGVRELLAAGVGVTVGLIAGMPGDDYSGFRASLEFVLGEVPGAELQVFPLALLPGTPLAARADALGLAALDRPPYTVVRTPGFSPEDLAACFELYERETGLELDPLGSPALGGAWGAGPEWPPGYVSGARLAARTAAVGWEAALASRAAQNLLIWIEGWREGLEGELGRLFARLPHAVVTVALEDEPGWPPERLSALLEARRGEHYLDRYFGLLYGRGARLVPRLAVLAPDGPVDSAWLEAVGRKADVVRVVEVAPGWTGRAAGWAFEGEFVHVRGAPPGDDLSDLRRCLGDDAPLVTFADPAAQAAWDDGAPPKADHRWVRLGA